jgi:hypothetical protein
VTLSLDFSGLRGKKKILENPGLVRLDGYVAVMGDIIIAYRNFVGKSIR